MRYLLDTSGDVKRAFASMDAKISELLSHRMCPNLLRKGYSMLKTFMKQQIESKQGGTSRQGSNSGGGLSSMMSKCTVM